MHESFSHSCASHEQSQEEDGEDDDWAEDTNPYFKQMSTICRVSKSQKKTIKKQVLYKLKKMMDIDKNRSFEGSDSKSYDEE